MKLLIFFFINFAISYCSQFHDYDLLEEEMKSGFIPGDYIIGALFPVRNTFDEDDFQCFGVNEYDGIQAVEAAYFAIDMVNKNDTILPNVTLGIDIEDYCNSMEVAIKQTKKLVDKSVSRSNATEDIFSKTQKEIHSPLIGIVGPDSGVISVEIQSILKFFSIVQIGYSEPITDFVEDSIDIYPYFMSIIPGNVYMTEAIFQILGAYNWTYVSLVHSIDSFGLSGMKQFQKLAAQKGVCIADIMEGERLAQYLSNNDDEIDSLDLSEIMPSYQDVDVIICYCSPAMVNVLFELIRGHGHFTKRFVVIGGDGWPPKQKNRYRLHPEVAVGELSVSLKQAYVRDFDDYYLSRNIKNNKRNPWFEEFWENNFKCSADDSTKKSEYPPCTGTEMLGENYEQNPKVPYIIKSVLVFAHALHDMLKDGCRDSHVGALPMENAFYKSCFMIHVRNVNFSFYGEDVNFEYARIPTVMKYNVHNFQKLRDGTYGYVQVGEYMESNINWKKKKIFKLQRFIQFPGNKTSVKSTCYESCSPRHAKVLRKDKCCWDCVLCKPLEILANLTQCLTCEYGFMSNENKTGCVPIPTKYTKWNDIQSLISLSFSLFCIVLILFTFVVFLIYKNTPAVKSSTKELCYVMFAGMILVNVTPFIVIPPPCEITCIAIRVIPAISFTMIYAALLVKTNRIARILAISKKKFPNLNLKFLSSKAQIIITSILIAIEIFICLYSLNKDEPRPYMVYREKNNSYYGVPMCPINKETITDTYAFIALLVIICTYYAVKTRNLPENFNEAKCIGFAMYATILTDVAFGFIYFGSEAKILTMCFGASINSLVILIFLFSPKLYIILWTPSKNNRANFTTTTSIRSYIGREGRSNESQKRSLEQRFNGDTISLETTTTELSIARKS